MLCLSRELTYIHEPFNPGIWPRWWPAPVPFRNLYVTADNEAPYLEPARAMLARRFPVRPQLGEVRSPRDAARLAREGARHALGRARPRATLVKDPIAVFSSSWLADRFGVTVVMMVRGPRAFAGSIKRLGWGFDFTQWTAQPLLMRDHLAPFAEEIHRATAERLSLVEQAILTWNVTYAYIDQMRVAHPDWHLVEYETLAAAPSEGFRALYGQLDLCFDDRVARGVAAHSDERNRREVPAGDKGGIRRDSAGALDTWQMRLTPDEVDLVDEGTSVVAGRLGISARGRP